MNNYNFVLGRKVENVQDLLVLARNSKSVFYQEGLNYSRVRPAAFIVNMSVCVVLRLIEKGMYIYYKGDQK